MHIKEIMTEKPVYCISNTNLQNVARMMDKNDCGEIPVVDDMDGLKPIGVITDRDIVLRAVAAGKSPIEATAKDCMSTPAVTATPDTDVEKCCQMMQEHKIRRIPVVDEDEHIVGIVSLADIALKMDSTKAGDVVQQVSQTVA